MISTAVDANGQAAGMRDFGHFHSDGVASAPQFGFPSTDQHLVDAKPGQTLDKMRSGVHHRENLAQN